MNRFFKDALMGGVESARDQYNADKSNFTIFSLIVFGLCVVSLALKAFLF